MTNAVSDMAFVLSTLLFVVAGVLTGSVSGFLMVAGSGFFFGLFMLAMFDF